MKRTEIEFTNYLCVHHSDNTPCNITARDNDELIKPLIWIKNNVDNGWYKVILKQIETQA